MPKNKKSKKNIYTHEIDLENLVIKNAPREEFRQKLEKIKYRGYEVEKLEDGRRIVITKPGGKFVFGIVKREDFMVWVFNPAEKSLWLISHKNIWEDLEEKGKVDRNETIKIISALERVLNGKEPDDILNNQNLGNPIGEPAELILKAYKWIWGQEDSNYPEGKGRLMSWEAIAELRDRLK